MTAILATICLSLCLVRALREKEVSFRRDSTIVIATIGIVFAFLTIARDIFGCTF